MQNNVISAYLCNFNFIPCAKRSILFKTKAMTYDRLHRYWSALQSEPILPIRRIRKMRRGPETSGGPLALKDFDFLILILVLILVLFFNLVRSYENMNDILV